MTHRTDRRPDTPMISAAATPCRLTYGNRARGFHQGQSNQLLANRPVIVTQSFLCSSALQFRGSPYSSDRREERPHRLGALEQESDAANRLTRSTSIR